MMVKKQLKQHCKIWKHSDQAFERGLYFFKFHEWTDLQKRKPKSLNIAVSMANRILHNVPIDKSSNLDSWQQALINTWKKMNGIKFNSKRNLVDEKVILKYESNVKNYDLNTRSIKR